ncbi:hypothetical protein [Marinobacter sp. JSM 1782161]|uniref:hypothetical protein n=1 Tax=Marinobacter sp. JSM 1782161 TaxID=2685906 RepID=UPI0014024B49|nr:hypothetical protein [Marinobacter sp. JSM 1782161]
MKAFVIPGLTRSGHTSRLLLTFGMIALLAGCGYNPVYQTTGAVFAGYSESEATPYVLQMGDADMACDLGRSLDPLVYSFSRVTDRPDTTGSLLQLLAANCSEQQAWEQELRYERAIFNDDVPEAKDARTAAKRWHELTAKRRLEAFNRAMRAYEYDPADPEAECPFLYADQDELTFLLGLLTGLQAIINDTNSGGAAGVPKDIAPQAERAAQCLDNEKWGGLPNAIRANVWLLLPDTRPMMSPDPWRLLKNSSELGVEAGFRASMALEAVAGETAGRRDVIEDVIRRFDAAESTIQVSEDYRLVDQVGRNVITHVSDKLWTREYGYRTPAAYFGQLSPESSSDTETMDLDDLL